ncbi:MAG: hypothetical protein ACOYNY_08300 [Caldilineaceae bacterium]
MQQNEVKRLLQTIYDAAEEETICHTNQAQIASYIDAELRGEPVAERYPALYEQIATCDTCRAIYAEGKALIILTATDQWVLPPVAGQFDFAYLATATAGGPKPPAQTEAVSWRLDALGRLIVALSVDFIRSLQPLTLQPAHLKARGNQPLFELTSPALGDEQQVTLVAKPMRGEANRYSVIVTVDIPSRGGWPHLAGTEVIFKAGEQVLKRETTDPFGKASLTGLDQETLGQLVVEVSPAAPA